MSRAVAASIIVPGDDDAIQPFSSPYYGDSMSFEKSKALSLDDSMLSLLPDRRAHRSMSRAGIFLSYACLQLQSALLPFLDASPFSVGIYCAIENGPVDLKSTVEMLDISGDGYAEQYRKSRNPKLFLMQLPNLAAAQMGIFLGIMGPMNVFNSSVYGSIHALQQAENDLADGRIKAALVCSAFSFENPLVLERIRRQNLGDRVLCEAAAALLLTEDNPISEWNDLHYDMTDSYYGISHQLVVQIKSQGGNQC